MAKSKRLGTMGGRSRSKKLGLSDERDRRTLTKSAKVAKLRKQGAADHQKGIQQASQIGLSVPFDPSHLILLVGEGDFSFSKSLITAHSCTKIWATTLESRSKLLEKYPQASSNTAFLEAVEAKVLYSIDATALCHPTKGGGSSFRKMGPWDRIVFNFPHTGGLTKDMNRQVRANQELCVKFLESACSHDVLAHGGRIVITLFEGEPYELWGIRNLARHVGLSVIRSTRFEWELYPDYSHARTLGNLRGQGGWKGEQRTARMYIFARHGEVSGSP